MLERALDYDTDLGHGPEHFAVEELVAHGAVEPLGVTVLFCCGDAHCDEDRFNPAATMPIVHGLGDELTAAVDRPLSRQRSGGILMSA